jgi:hypothetical protein
MRTTPQTKEYLPCPLAEGHDLTQLVVEVGGGGEDESRHQVVGKPYIG